jgi:hypothetical protein
MASRRTRLVFLAVLAVLGGILAGVLPSLASASLWTATRLNLPLGTKANGSGYAGPISCPALHACVVLGQAQTPAGDNLDVIASQTSTGAWHSAVAPLPAGAIQAANLGPVVLSCPAPGTCVGTSLYTSAAGLEADILQETNGKWAALPLPLPANAVTGGANYAQVTGIACPSTTNCVIVGSYKVAAGFTEGFVVTHPDKSWTAAEAPTPGLGNTTNHGAVLNGVACGVLGSCVAVGSFVNIELEDEPMVVSVTTSAMTASQPRLPGNAAKSPSANLDVVACGSSTSCVTLGTYKDAVGNTHGVVETSGTASWAAAETPAPAGASTVNPDVVPYGLTCTAATSCVAVAEYTINRLVQAAAVLLDSSGTWTAETAVSDGTSTQLTAVKCWAAFRCQASGTYDAPRGGGVQGYLLAIVGSRQAWQQAPVPASAARNPLVSLNSLACPAASTCVATGSYDLAASTVVQMPEVLTESST